MTTDVRKPRADAVRNREALLDAASELFTEQGCNASLELVAKRAGVGVGTLYRHFPARNDLIAAVYRRGLETVADAAPDLIAQHDGMTALHEWTERFLAYAATKRNLGEALRAIMDDSPELRSSVLPKLHAALDQLLEHGAADGTIREDVRSDDLLRAMAGVFHIPKSDEWAEQARRILNLLLDGLAPR